jgi:predicted PurR-regulated permease PerM
MPEQEHRAHSAAAMWRHLEQPVRILVYLLIALVVVMLYHQAEYLVVHLFNVLLLFIFAAIIALLLTPVIDLMEKVPPFTGRRTFAVLLVYVVILGLIAFGIALVSPALIGQARQLPALQVRAIAFIQALQAAINNAGIPLKLSLPSGTGGISTAVIGSVFGVLTGTLGTLISLLLIIVISIYLLVEGRQLIASMRKLFPGHEEVYDFTLVAVGTTFGQYVRGQLVMSLVMGTYTAIGMTLVGVPYAVVIGILTFFLEFLPLIGAPVGMGIAVLIALIFKGPFVALVALLVAVGGHAIEAYILGPRVTGSATRIHPLVAMAALLVGADLGGILGALFGVPVAALLNVFLGALYRARRGEEAPLSASPSGEVHAEALPRLSEEISEAADEGPMEDKPIPHTASEGESGRKAAS